MKINQYQKAVLIWGVMMCIGYVLTDYYIDNLLYILIVWTTVISISLFFQAVLMWYWRLDGYLTHLTWLTVSLTGGVATYLKVYGYVDNPILITTMWFILTAAGMVFTAVFQKNISYIILAVLYSVAAAVFQFGLKSEELTLAGIIFLVLGVVDALLEYSPFRHHLAHFTEEYMSVKSPHADSISY